MEQITFRAMGSEIFCALDSWIVSATNPLRAQEYLARVPAMFEVWEQTLSRFRADSELSHLNAHAGECTPVSETLWCVLKLAERAETWSDGLVTPTVLPAVQAAGYDRSFDELRTTGAQLERWDSMNTGMAPPSHGSLWELYEVSHSVTLAPHTQLDLGGIAKGWAAEQTANYLDALGPVLVDAGGDMVVTAPRSDGSGWTIGIENLFDLNENSLPLLQLSHGAVATSGRDYRKWTHNGKPAHHLIDPRTGLPAVTDVLTATVIAPTIFQAEVAAKVALLLGSCQGVEWIEMHDALAALFILEDETVLLSQRMNTYLL
jgi:FAD:protein FMN transferase